MWSVRSELNKAASLGVPTYAAAVTVALVVGLSAALTALVQNAAATGRDSDVGGLEASSSFLVLLHYGQIGIVLLGSWLMVEEQEPGCLRTALLATPSRSRLFAAKAVVAAVGSFVVATVTVLGSYAVRCWIAGAGLLTTSSGEEVRVLLGYIGYWTLLGVFAFGVSATVRNGVVGLATLLVVVLALSSYLLSLTPLARFLPDQAGAQMYQEVLPTGMDLGPGLGLTVLSMWVLAAIVGGGLSFRTWPVRQ